MSSSVSVKNNKNQFLSILSGTIVAVAITLVLILLFALIIRFFNVADSWIFPINQVIKVISLFVGTIVVLKKQKKSGFLNGLLISVLYFFLSYIIFSILQGNFAFNLSKIYDLLLTALMGGIIGIITINVVKNR